MKIQRNRLTTIGLMWAFVSLPFAQSRVNAADPQFDKIVEDYFAARYEYRPSEGTAAGLHEYDHRLEDLSQESVIRRIEELVEFKRRLAALAVGENHKTRHGFFEHPALPTDFTQGHDPSKARIVSEVGRDAKRSAGWQKV